MTERQRVHIGMMNSYNILTGKARVIEVVESAIPIFAHVIDRPIKAADLYLIRLYFEEIEEYEKCIEISCLSQTLFDENGKRKEIQTCKCDMPSIPKYDDIMKCKTCDKHIVYESYYE